MWNGCYNSVFCDKNLKKSLDQSVCIGFCPDTYNTPEFPKLYAEIRMISSVWYH